MSSPLFISSEKIQEASERYNSWKDEPVKPKRSEREELIPSAIEATFAQQPEDPYVFETDQRRKKMLQEIGQEPADFAYERAIGKNDAVYSNFVDLIVEAKRKTGRIVLKDSSEKTLGYATGFMVSENLLLTNWHVFKTKEDAEHSEIQFNYEYDTRGTPQQPTVFKLDPTTFFHAEDRLDYCFVAVKQTDIHNCIPLASIGYIFLDASLGKLGNDGEESLNIIHHPEGDYKQLSIRENLLKKKMDNFLWYHTDTAQGSSGAPVFNDQWQVVALHHMGVPKMDGDQYIDKAGQLFKPDDNGWIDATRVVWEANEGVRISVILKDLFATFPDSAIVNKLRGFSPNSSQPPGASPVIDESNRKEASETIHISVPVSLIASQGTFNISMGNTLLTGSQHLPQQNKPLSEGLAESLTLSNAMDYSSCKGYQSNFLGMNIPIPKPKTKLKKFIAKMQNSESTILKYHHYSVLFHSVRKMPALSAINVDADTEKRKDETKRDDNWLLDNRLSYDMQLNDDFYSKSGFDRGHMSRREDANWGNTAKDALESANLTCMYTNACPQVGKLNRSNLKGLWGKLEMAILEKGASKESGRISVFNGPIFKADDPVFRGVHVPMSFFKVILWLDDEQQLKATAFKLTQVGLTDGIDFSEALDIHLDPVFKEYQVSLKWLSKVTDINFSPLEVFDTFSGEGMKLLTNVEELHETIQEAKRLSSR